METFLIGFTGPAQYDVVQQILEERQEQDAKWGGPPHDMNHIPREWLELVAHKLLKATIAVARGPSDETIVEYRKRMIQIAALSLAAVETFDAQLARVCAQGEDV